MTQANATDFRQRGIEPKSKLTLGTTHWRTPVDEPTTMLSERIDQLLVSMNQLEQRVAQLEHAIEGGEAFQTPPPRMVPFEEAPSAAASSPESVDSPDAGLPLILPLIGRSLVALAGASFLRFVTDHEIFPDTVGVLLGLAYAFVGIGLANWDGRRGRSLSAAFHGSVAALIGAPLLWEATTRFHVFSPTASAVILLILAGSLLRVSWRREILSLPWIMLIIVLPVVILLVRDSHQFVVWGLWLMALGLVVFLFEQREPWRFLIVPVALVSDMILFFFIPYVTSGRSAESAASAVVLLVLFALVYLLAPAWLALTGRAPLSGFDLVQSAAATLIGLIGASRVMMVWLGTAVPLGVLLLALGAAGYLLAYGFHSGGRDDERGFEFFATTGLFTAVFAAALLWSGNELAWMLAVAASAAALAGRQFDQPLGRIHGIFVLLAAAVPSGLALHLIQIWTWPASATWAAADADSIAVVVLAVGLLFAVGTRASSRLEWLADFALTLLVVASVGAFVCDLLARVLAHAPGPAADPGLLATVRTAVLVGMAITLAGVSRFPALSQGSTLAYPILLVGGAKLVVEDFRVGRPMTLFIALALYGSSLIVMPPLRRRARLARKAAAAAEVPPADPPSSRPPENKPSPETA